MTATTARHTRTSLPFGGEFRNMVCRCGYAEIVKKDQMAAAHRAHVAIVTGR